jgi:hypothetical protein
MGAAMRELGWERTKRRFDGKVRWAYVKGDGRTTIYALLTAGEPENGDDLRSSRSRDPPF